MASSSPGPPSQSGTRLFGDVVDQVLRFVQQPPASTAKNNPKSGSAEDLSLNTTFASSNASSGRTANYSPTSSPNGERGPWYGREHEASPLSPSRTLVASSSSSPSSSSSTPRSRYRPLKRSESSGSTSSSTSRSTATQNRSSEGGTRQGAETETEKGGNGKRMNVSDRLRRLGRKMQAQKGRLASPRVSPSELADEPEGDRDRDRRMSAGAAAPSPYYPGTPDTGRRTVVQAKGKGQGKPHRAPGAHAKLLSMVAEADEPSTPSISTSTFPSTSTASSRFSRSEATTPTAVYTPTASRTRTNLAPSAPNHADRPSDAPPEPTTLAARIHALLLTALPFPSFPGPRPDAPTATSLPPSASQSIPKDPPSPPTHTSPPAPELSASKSPPPLPPSPPASAPRDSGYGYDYSYDYSTDIDTTVQTDATGRPIPPPYASPLPPRERQLLEEILSSPVIMNGELPQESPQDAKETDAQAQDERPGTQKPPISKPAARVGVTRSIWSVLESMGVGASKAPAPEPDAAPVEPQRNRPSTDTTTTTGSGENENESMYSDTGSSVMIYSPLIPSGAQDLPELAEVAPVSVVAQHLACEGHGQAGASTAPTATTPTPTAAASPSDANAADAASSWIPSTVRQWSFVQAISGWSAAAAAPAPSPANSTATNDDGTGTGANASTIPLASSSATTISTASAAPGNNQQPSPSAAVRKAWVPSTTKMSVQAMWWGYRLYLPPPVMAILSDRTLEASKRAALITAALTWFFANLPIAALPPPLQPAALLLQRLAPFLGYIGAFISWSWGVIEGYDVGYGVTLTATWLLPMALIPGTWHKDEFPTSPAALGQPVPLPQVLYSPAPASHRALAAPVEMIQTAAGPVPARVTEFLPLPTPPPTTTTTAANQRLEVTPTSTAMSTPTLGVIPTPLPSSPTALHSTFLPAAAQPSPPMTPTPIPPTPISPSRTPRPRREAELAPSTPQSYIGSAMSSPAQTPSSHYQTPLASSPAPTSSSLYQTPLSSPHAPLSPSLPHPAPLAYRDTPMHTPAPIPLTPSTPTSPLQMRTQMHASGHPPAPSTPASLSPSPTHTLRPHPQSYSSKSRHTATTHVSASVPAAATSVVAPPIPLTPVQASVNSPNLLRKSKATTSSRSQSHSETRPPSYASPTHVQYTNTDKRTAPSATRTHSDYNRASVPVGSPLEQHLLSGPLMSPIALPDVDLPVSPPPSLPAPALASATAHVPADDSARREEERKRERERDKARIRERARAIFRRTNSSGTAGTQKAKA